MENGCCSLSMLINDIIANKPITIVLIIRKVK